MWCEKCQADVAAEVSAETRQILCATCGTVLDPTAGLGIESPQSPRDPAGDARDLLERWASESVLDLKPPTNPAPPANAPPPPLPSTQPVFRFDGPHPLGTTGRQATPAPPVNPQIDTPQVHSGGHPPGPRRPRFADSANRRPMEAVGPDGSPISGGPETNQPADLGAMPPTPPGGHPGIDLGGSGEPEQPRYRFDAAEAGVGGPHFTPDPLVFRKTERSSGWIALAGQILAYGGVALITVGTALVLGGYFGGPENYTPTGWLTATVGQMLLFLGVVTLVSTGMEQTNAQVTERVEQMSEHILRFEHHARLREQHRQAAANRSQRAA